MMESRQNDSNFVERKLGLHHIAFFRGYMDGLDLAVLGKQYLETGDDLVRAKTTLRWVKDVLISTARRYRPSYVRLLRIPIERLSVQNAYGGMTLEAFREERDPEGYCSEQELIEIFLQEYGDGAIDRKAAQADRLRQKLRDAVAFLERKAAAPPETHDPIEAWFDPPLARLLTAAGQKTLADVIDLIARRGKWYRKIPKLGPIKSARVEHWLLQRGLLTQPPAYRLPTPVRSSEIVPIERLMLPTDLSGATGKNRAYGPALRAADDREAIEAWLSSLRANANTRRSYRKEAERFLLWCIFERGIALSSAGVEDCTDYRDFLAAIGNANLPWRWRLPQERWIGARNVQRWSTDWRPFAGPLTLSSQRQAITILRLMFEWLMRQKYLQTNPWDGVASLLPHAPTLRKDRHFSMEQWRMLLQILDEMKDRNESWHRLRFVLMLGRSTGLRLSEMAALRVAGPDGIGLRPAEDGDGYDIVVIGKGSKQRSVPVSSALLETMIEYMMARGYPANPAEWPPETPLIASLPWGEQYVQNGGAPLSESAIYKMLKSFFMRAAREMPIARDAGHLLRASTHWLRHTCATHALEANVDVRDVQEILGHASPATTAIYSHSSRKRKKSAVEMLP